MSYGPTAREHFRHPRNVGTLDHPTAVGTEGTPGKGNYMTIHVRVDRGRIAAIRYQTYGCAGAIASGSVLTEMAKGETIQEAARITAEQLIATLGGLPLGKTHCAGLAVSALRKAVKAVRQPAASGPPQA